MQELDVLDGAHPLTEISQSDGVAGLDIMVLTAMQCISKRNIYMYMVVYVKQVHQMQPFIIRLQDLSPLHKVAHLLPLLGILLQQLSCSQLTWCRREAVYNAYCMFDPGTGSSNSYMYM